MKRIQFYLILVIFLVIGNILFAQVKTNNQLVDWLIDLSAEKIVNELEIEENLNVNFVGANDYLILKSKLYSILQKKNIKIVEDKSNQTLNYYLNVVNIDYSDVFRDGLFGSFKVERKAKISGRFNLASDNISEMKEFNISSLDTINYNEISELENIAYSFTSSEIPEVPVFSGLLEPAIAIGSAAITVYLFFNIRSR